jgi:hypothetical protein
MLITMQRCFCFGFCVEPAAVHVLQHGDRLNGDAGQHTLRERPNLSACKSNSDLPSSSMTCSRTALETVAQLASDMTV